MDDASSRWFWKDSNTKESDQPFDINHTEEPSGERVQMVCAQATVRSDLETLHWVLQRNFYTRKWEWTWEGRLLQSSKPWKMIIPSGRI